VGVTRREFVAGGAAAGALLLARPGKVGAAPVEFGTSRTSRVFPDNGTFVVHSDLHNHSTLSDGATAADQAFQMMKDAQLDVAALTDHALFGKTAGNPCSHPQCAFYLGIDEESWQVMKALADANHRDGDFVAMRGFEWTTGTIGHVNVWFTEQWIDSFTTLGIQSTRGLPELFATLPEPFANGRETLEPLFAELPESATMDLFYEWLMAPPDRPVVGGGADGLAGFNHPNLFGNFDNYRFVPGLVDRLVSCEAINGTDDYLFWGLDEGQPSPLTKCLDAGWRVGMLGVSDEHFDGWAQGKARGGLWVRELTRAGVREAMEARRFYASLETGLRFDAAANGVQMGGSLPHRSGPIELVLDIDGGADSYGRPLSVQVLASGGDQPVVVHAADVVVPHPSEPLITLRFTHDVEDGRWLLVRVTDPAMAPTNPTPEPFVRFGRAVLYASPFFLEPDTVVPAQPTPAAPAAPPASPGTGGALARTGGAPSAAAALAMAAAGLAMRRLGRDHHHDDDHDHDHDHDHDEHHHH
jgi:hypothetical protein